MPYPILKKRTRMPVERLMEISGGANFTRKELARIIHRELDPVVAIMV